MSFLQKQVNVAVQVLPTAPTKKEAYAIVDKAIEVIRLSGVKYRVTPFETVMEGTYSSLMEIVARVQEVCYTYGAADVMCYVKIQSSGSGDVTIDDKMEKYD
jgi:uncharacterized protein YqgV (UPF0045/DUF77 family)